MSIHSEHPFVPPVDLRDPIRRLRGRLPAPVTVWTSVGAPTSARPGAGEAGRTWRDGWTVSSLLIGEGELGQVVALLDEDAEYWELLAAARTATINVLGPGQGAVADAFARLTPSPGGPFRTGEWAQDAPEGQAPWPAGYGPRLTGAAAWVGVRLVEQDPVHAGWALLVRATIEWLELAEGVAALTHLRGAYSAESAPGEQR